ncbi:1464_t:CDS:2, partial [Entrophospora sp. SA101]
MNNLKKIFIMLTFTLPRRKKTEPMLLWWTKDEPSIQYTTTKLDSQRPLPAFSFGMVDQNVTIHCATVMPINDDDVHTKRENCSTSFKLVDREGSRYYKFTPINNSRLLFLHWNHTGNGISVITFGGELDDIRDNYPGQTNLQNYIDFLQSNRVIIQENKENDFFIEWTRRKYLIRDWTNYLGFPNHHVSLHIAEPIVSSNYKFRFQLYDLFKVLKYIVIQPFLISKAHTTSSYENQTTVYIIPYGYTNNYFETVETEKRFETVLSNIGPLGGAISLLLGIYAILFGGSLLNPWGIFQNHCCKYKSRSKRKLLKNLSVIPLTEKNQLYYEKSKDLDIISLRFNSLETILREYIINADFLDELETEKIDIGIDE